MGSNSASPSPPGGQALGGLPKAALHFPSPSPEFGVLLTSSWQPWTFLAQPPMHFLTLAIKLTFPGLGDAEMHIMPGIKPVLSPALLVTVNVGSEPVTGVKTAASGKQGGLGSEAELELSLSVMAIVGFGVTLSYKAASKGTLVKIGLRVLSLKGSYARAK